MTVNNIPLKQMKAEVVTKVHQDDPSQSDRCITREEVNTWVGARSLAMGVVLERHGAILEDAFWLHPTSDAQHITDRTRHHTRGQYKLLQLHLTLVDRHLDGNISSLNQKPQAIMKVGNHKIVD